MKILKKILLGILFSGPVLGSGDMGILPLESDTPKPLTIEEGFIQNMTYIPENDPSHLMEYFRKTGMMIFPYFTGEDLKDWIEAFSGLLLKENRLEFTRSMNANFFGIFYKNKNATRIPRLQGSRDVYVPFAYQTMQILFSRLTLDETTTLLTPFLDDLLKNRDLLQGLLFFMRGIGVSPEDIAAPEKMIDFFKNPSTTEIPDALLCNPRFISILFEKSQRKEIYLSEMSNKKLQYLYNLVNFAYKSKNKMTDIKNHLQNIQNLKSKKFLEDFLYRCIMEDPQTLGKDRLSAAHELSDAARLESKKHHPQILASLHNIADQAHDLKYEDEGELGSLLEEVYPHIQNIESERSLLTFINTPTRFSWIRLDALSWLNTHFQYSPAQLQNCLIPIMQNSNDPFFDHLRVKNALKEDSLVENYYKEVKYFLLFILQKHPRGQNELYDWHRPSGFKLLERVKELGQEYYPQIYQCLLEIIKEDKPMYNDLIKAIDMLKNLEEKHHPQASKILLSIMNNTHLFGSDWDLDIDFRLEAGDHLKKFGEPYYPDLAQGFISIIDDIKDYDLKDTWTAVEKLEELGKKYYPELTRLLISIMNDSENLNQRRTAANKSTYYMAHIRQEFYPQIAKILLPIIQNPQEKIHCRLEAAKNLTKLGKQYYPQIANSLLPIMKNSQEETYNRLKAAENLTELGEKNYPEIENFLLPIMQNPQEKTYCRLEAAENLTKLGEKHYPEIENYLLPMMRNSQKEIYRRLEAADNLTKLGEKHYPEMENFLLPMMQNSQEEIYRRLKAAEILTKLGGKFYREITDFLIFIAQNAENDKKTKLRAAQALKELSETMINELKSEE